jgi:hypothetical protein
MEAVTSLFNSEHSHFLAQLFAINFDPVKSNSNTFHPFTLLFFNSLIQKMVGTLFILLIDLLIILSLVYLLSLMKKDFLLNFGLKKLIIINQVSLLDLTK